MSLPFQSGIKSNYLSEILTCPLTGMVHSKFRNSMNLMLGDDLIYIGSEKRHLPGFGITLPEPELRQLLNSCSVGDRALWKPAIIRFYGAGALRELDLDVLGTLDLRVRQVDMTREEIRSSTLMGLISAIDFRGLTGILPDENTHMYMRLLEGKEDRFYKEILAHFTGRGLGLTPGGDDLLYGYTLSQKLFVHNPLWLRMWEENDWSKTTAISEAYAKTLARGYTGKDWVDLAALLKGGSEKEIKLALEAVQDFGHTSGNDALMGFYLGLKAIVNGE